MGRVSDSPMHPITQVKASNPKSDTTFPSCKISITTCPLRLLGSAISSLFISNRTRTCEHNKNLFLTLSSIKPQWKMTMTTITRMTWCFRWFGKTNLQTSLRSTMEDNFLANMIFSTTFLTSHRAITSIITTTTQTSSIAVCCLGTATSWLMTIERTSWRHQHKIWAKLRTRISTVRKMRGGNNMKRPKSHLSLHK